jgi:hypothetical protein
MRTVEPIEVSLDKPRHLLLTMGGLKAAERELNKSRKLEPRQAIFRIMMDELSRIQDGDCAMDFCEAILWASMLHEEPDLSLESVGNMPWDLPQIFPLVTQLIMATYLKMESDAAPETEKKNLTKLNGIADSGVSPE